MAVTNEEFKWTDDSVIDFVNWYVEMTRLPFNYTLENQEIIDSFKRGDDPKLWWERPGERTPTEVQTMDDIKSESFISAIIDVLNVLSPDKIEFLITILTVKLKKLNKTKGVE